MRFNSLLNKLLEEHNATPIEGIAYEQCFIVEKKGFYYVFLNNRIVHHGKTIQEMKEYINSINSGC